MKIILSFLLLATLQVTAQDLNYADSIKAFRDRYTSTHGVVTGEDRQALRFFPADHRFVVPARVEKIDDAPWFKMETSGTIKKVYRVYAILHFSITGKPLKLRVYQSQTLMKDPQYADHLFIPFTDKTSGDESYEGGRYIDLRIADLENPGFLLDFNKAYNPYCAYVSNKYNCPIPPPENELDVAIRAGEMKFKGSH